MPSDGKYGFSVLVAGRSLPEYQHPKDERRVLVESMLWTPVTYWLDVSEYCKFSEEMERQKWPVTPFEIRVYAEPHCVKSRYEVFVDGVKVKTFILDRGESKIVKGFPEGEGGYSEFLFSLPRFAESENDRVKQERESKIGKIEVVRHATSFSHCEFRAVSSKSRECKFKQATKKDVSNVIKSSNTQSTADEDKLYTMATTRRGKYIRDSKPYDRPEHAKRKKTDESPHMQKKQIWYKGEELGRLVVEYHMTNTLWDWNIDPKRPDWPEVDLGTVVIDD